MSYGLFVGLKFHEGAWQIECFVGKLKWNMCLEIKRCTTLETTLFRTKIKTLAVIE